MYMYVYSTLSLSVCDGQQVTADSRILIDLVCGSEIAPVSTKSLSLSLLPWTSSPSSHSLRNIHECARDYLNANTSNISFYHQVVKGNQKVGYSGSKNYLDTYATHKTIKSSHFQCFKQQRLKQLHMDKQENNDSMMQTEFNSALKQL